MLLSLLSNPLNVTLLTTHLLMAPAVWSVAVGLQVPLRVLATFQAASAHVRASQGKLSTASTGLPLEEWAHAVIQGANEKCERWKHTLVLGGLLTSLATNGGWHRAARLRTDLESAVVTASNLSFQDAATEAGGELAEFSICLVLSQTFNFLSVFEKAKLETARLVSLIPKLMFFSPEGLHHGYFLGMLDKDVVQGDNDRFSWSTQSRSFYQFQEMANGPVFPALGPLATLAAFGLNQRHDMSLLLRVGEDIMAFCRSLSIQWRQNKLSEIAEGEEEQFLTEETLRSSLPLLWQVLKSAMFSVIVLQRVIVGHLVGNGKLSPESRLVLASQTLHSLRHLYFIVSRMGHGSLSQLTFIHVSCIDILARHPERSEVFLRDIRPGEMGRVPGHPHERCLDLYFLNTAEHFALCLSPAANEELLLEAAVPYFGVGGDPRLLEMFEAAHSVGLAVFSVPHNHALTARHLPFYVDTLFNVFPQNLSARQFRLAIRTVVRLVSPPSPVSITDPLLAATILEMLRSRASTASTSPLPPDGMTMGPPLFEQAVLVHALLDCLPSLLPETLQLWMPLAAESVEQVAGADQAEACRVHFWHVLSGDGMNGPQSDAATFWWTTQGGREMVFNSSKSLKEKGTEPIMSGAL